MGWVGLSHYLLARYEVYRALKGQRLRTPIRDSPDRLPANSIFSFQSGERHERVLAMLDQDGFAFARDEVDASFFNKREMHLPKKGNAMEIVLRKDKTVLRKRFCGFQPSRGARGYLRDGAGLSFYLEAAALLRLRGLACVPQIHDIDIVTRTIEMEFLAGHNLRHMVAAGGQPVFDADMRRDARLRELPMPKRIAREFRLFTCSPAARLIPALREAIRSINHRGVALRDFHLANAVIGQFTGQPYLLDFDLCHLRPLPGWKASLKHQWTYLNECLGQDPKENLRA